MTVAIGETGSPSDLGGGTRLSIGRRMLNMTTVTMMKLVMAIITCKRVGHQQIARFLLSMQFTLDCSDTLVVEMMILMTAVLTNISINHIDDF